MQGFDYNVYEQLGNKKRTKLTDYNSDNTYQLNIDNIVKLLKETKIDLD